MTVVEMLVASLILAIGVVGVATLFVASSESGAVARGQADATDIATSEIELLRAIPYGEVGISPAATGYEPVVDGRPTVTEPGTNRVEPIGVVSRNGVDYDVERSVTWQAVGSEPQGYKVVSIVVRWETTAGGRTVSMQTGRYEASP